jgi:hypothetical protein
MKDSEKLVIAMRLIIKQSQLIESFDDWIRLVKIHDLEGASEIVKLADKLRLEIRKLKGELAEANKKSNIILLKN